MVDLVISIIAHIKGAITPPALLEEAIPFLLVILPIFQALWLRSGCEV